eukprot:Em0877g3a
MLGKPAAFDFTVISPLVSNILPEASVTAGSAAFVAEVKKNCANDAKYAELVGYPSHLQYRLMGVELVGVSQLASQLATRQNCPKSTASAALYGRLSLTLVRANVMAILSRTILDFN